MVNSHFDPPHCVTTTVGTTAVVGDVRVGDGKGNACGVPRRVHGRNSHGQTDTNIILILPRTTSSGTQLMVFYAVSPR